MHWSSIFWRIATLYFFAFLIFAAYWSANFTTKNSRRHSDTAARWPEKLKAYGMCLFVVLCISGFFSIIGGPTEDDPNIPEPTIQQRETTFVRVFLFLLPATMLGVFQAFETDKKLTPEERQKLNSELITNSLKADRNDD